MGQKVNPISFRLGVNKTWSSRWFSGKRDYADILHRDITLRRALNARLKDSGVAKIEIERKTGEVIVNIYTSKPGIIIGRQGAAIEDLRNELSLRFGEKIEVNIVEVTKPDNEAQLIAESIASQIERRMPYRRAAKQSISRTMEGGTVKGIKIRIAGRLNGADIARNEIYKEGNVPLHTIRADIDFASIAAKTTYGAIGIKVWIYKGEIFMNDTNTADKKASNDNFLAASRKKKPAEEEAGRLEKELTKKAA